jgi:hypothetical protein
MSKCVKCDSRKNVVEHHVKYEPEKTVMLCASCHGEAHSRDDHEFAPSQEMPHGFNHENKTDTSDTTTIGLSGRAKEQAQDAKHDNETWDDYLQRCTDEPPEIREYVEQTGNDEGIADAVEELKNGLSVANDPGVELDTERLFAALRTIEERTGRLEQMLEEMGGQR